MSDRQDPNLDDAELRRALGTLKPPQPSDLLRARVENAIHGTAASAPMPDAHVGAPPRRAFYGRIAASVILALGVALGTWLPAPQRISGGPGNPQWATTTTTDGTNGGTGFTGQQSAQDAGANGTQENELGLALVGGGASVTGIGLVRAQFDGTDGAADDGFDSSNGNGADTAFNTGSGFENVSFETGGNALDSIPLY
jgi:hypothetical protein